MKQPIVCDDHIFEYNRKIFELNNLVISEYKMDRFDRCEYIAHVSKRNASLSPGPAHYNVNYSFMDKKPAIVMRGRHSQKIEHMNPPLYNPPSTFGKVTGITLHGRTETKRKWETPGPTFIPPSFGSGCRTVAIAPLPKNDGAKTSLARRRNPDETPGPGPAASVLRDSAFDANGKVGYTIKGCHNFEYAKTVSPGPGAYMPKFAAVLPSAPKIGFHNRPEEKPTAETPGYRNLGSTLGEGPKWTMKARATDDISVV